MNKKLVLSLTFIALSGFLCTAVYAQTDVNMWATQPVTVDGNSLEWHEPLNNYNSETKLAFGLSNDQNNLYMIIESLDETTTRRLLSGGITLNINTSGKKKDGVKLLFLGMHQPSLNPVKGDVESENKIRDRSNDEKPSELTIHEGEGHSLNMIQVSGFKTIPNGSLPIPNQQKIQVAAEFNKQKDYICELSIPLDLLDFKGKNPGAIAYDIKINSAGFHEKRYAEGGQKTQGIGNMSSMHSGGGMGGGGRHGAGGGMGGKHGGERSSGYAIPEGKEVNASDFWIKYELAKPTATFRAD